MKEILKESEAFLKAPVMTRSLYHDQLTHLAQTKEVLIVTWQRRTGKSSIVRDFIKDKKACYLNKELDLENVVANAVDLQMYLELWKKEYWNPDYVVIDEVQDIQDREKAIRAWRAKDEFTTIITWSNSTLLSWELATFLTWRYFEIPVYSLSYQEFCQFQDVDPSLEIFEKYLARWWLPELHFIPQDDLTQRRYIQYVWESTMYQDVLRREWVPDIELFQKIWSFLSHSTWFEISHKKIADTLTSHQRKTHSATVHRYINAMEYALLIDRVSRFDLKGKRILAYLEKFYFTDHGIRNMRWYSRETDIWKVLENIVYIELKRRWYEVTVGKRNAYEIDFIARKWEQRVAIQVSYLVHDQNMKREVGNLEKLPDSFPKIVLSMNPWREYSLNEQWIILQHVHHRLTHEI